MLCNRLLAHFLLTNARGSCDLPKTLLRSQLTFFVKSFSLKRRTADENAFTVAYLISSCGLSPETALRASEKVHFQAEYKPDSVINLLRNYGFTDTHISKLVRTHPIVLLYDPKKTLLPKLEFCKSIVVPKADLANILSSHPTLLDVSLENQLIPVYNYLKHVILLDDKQVTKNLRPSSRIFRLNLEKQVIPKIATLRELGVPASSLSLLMTHFANVLSLNNEKFDKALKKVLETGVNPLKSTFVDILKMIVGLSKQTWEHKIEVFRKCGWSEADFQAAFKRWPYLMSRSENKIKSVNNFLVNDMGLEPTAIARVPTIFHYDLKKRTIPRCLVVKILILEGLIKRDVSLGYVLVMNDKCFLDKYVTKYEDNLPHLLDVFNGKVGLPELGYESKEICGSKNIVASASR